MMVCEAVTDTLVKHYSDRGVYIRQVETGILYAQAVDVLPCRYTYAETEELLEGGGEGADSL